MLEPHANARNPAGSYGSATRPYVTEQTGTQYFFRAGALSEDRVHDHQTKDDPSWSEPSRQPLPSCGSPLTNQIQTLPRALIFTTIGALTVSLTGKHKQTVYHAKAFLWGCPLVRLHFTHSLSSCGTLTMDPIVPPPVPDPTTPNRLFPRANRIATPNRFTTTFATSSQPVGSTQRALQESLTDNVVYANETIVHAIFQPSKVDRQSVMDILAEIGGLSDLTTSDPLF